VGALANGAFVVAWADMNTADGTQGIFARVHHANGEMRDEAFAVTKVGPTQAFEPSVSALRDGGFVIAWVGTHVVSGNDQILTRVYDAEGAPLGDALPVSEIDSALKFGPSVTALSDGGFVVAWAELTDMGRVEILVRTYGPESEPLDTFIVAHGGTSPAVTGLKDGSFVIAWEQPEIGDTNEIFVTRLDGAGSTWRAPFRVTETGSASTPSVAALADGGFIVTWVESQATDQIWARVYDGAGQSLGEAFTVREASDGLLLMPSVAALPDGRFVIAWRETGTNSGIENLFGRMYDSDGRPLDKAFAMTETSNALELQITALADGGFVLTGRQANAGSGVSEIFTRIYSAPKPGANDTGVGVLALPAFVGAIDSLELVEGMDVSDFFAPQEIEGDAIPAGDVIETDNFPSANQPIWASEVSAAITSPVNKGSDSSNSIITGERDTSLQSLTQFGSKTVDDKFVDSLVGKALVENRENETLVDDAGADELTGNDDGNTTFLESNDLGAFTEFDFASISGSPKPSASPSNSETPPVSPETTPTAAPVVADIDSFVFIGEEPATIIEPPSTETELAPDENQPSDSSLDISTGEPHAAEAAVSQDLDVDASVQTANQHQDDLIV
jgi:hypothetical protein